jgi:predicted transcriptional regulator of viral defense system
MVNLAAGGRYSFDSSEARAALGVSIEAAKAALSRLAKQKLIASPAQGFYIIIPPEYRSLGCLPADQFVPALMKRQGLAYYAGLLSAAQYYGSAHHRPQEYQVVVEKNRRPITCGAVRVAFIARKRIKDVPTQSFNTPRGTVAVSTAEATALDLAGYPGHAGGLDQVATVLGDLAERLDPQKLVTVAETAPVSWVQRLGYLLERAGAEDKAGPLKAYVRQHAVRATVLAPTASQKSGPRNVEWKLDINLDVEPEA